MKGGRCLLHDILLQATQPFFRGLKDIIVFAYSKTEIVFSNVCVLVGIELCWRNCSHSNLVDEEPAKLEVPRAVGYMGREFVVLWEFDRRHICEDKVATFGVRVLMRVLAQSIGGDAVEIINIPGYQAP